MILVCFVDGIFKPTQSDLTLLPLNIAFDTSQGGLVMQVNDDVHLPPIKLLFLGEKDQKINNKITVGVNSSVTLIEEYQAHRPASYSSQIQTELILNEHSNVNHFKIQDESITAHHQSIFILSQKKNSFLKRMVTDLGGAKVSEKVNVNLGGENTQTNLFGLHFLTAHDQKLEHLLEIEHRFSGTQSFICYKGVLQNKSKSIFKAKTIVPKKVNKINAHQANHNLLLSPNAEVSSKPELEIYSEDVKCTHGSTVGQLNEEALFYLRARGLTERQSRKILIESFARDILDKIDFTYVKKKLEERVANDEFVS